MLFYDWWVIIAKCSEWQIKKQCSLLYQKGREYWRQTVLIKLSISLTRGDTAGVLSLSALLFFSVLIGAVAAIYTSVFSSNMMKYDAYICQTCSLFTLNCCYLAPNISFIDQYCSTQCWQKLVQLHCEMILDTWFHDELLA